MINEIENKITNVTRARRIWFKSNREDDEVVMKHRENEKPSVPAK